MVNAVRLIESISIVLHFRILIFYRPIVNFPFYNSLSIDLDCFDSSTIGFFQSSSIVCRETLRPAWCTFSTCCCNVQTKKIKLSTAHNKQLELQMWNHLATRIQSPCCQVGPTDTRMSPTTTERSNIFPICLVFVAPFSLAPDSWLGMHLESIVSHKNWTNAPRYPTYACWEQRERVCCRQSIIYERIRANKNANKLCSSRYRCWIHG